MVINNAILVVATVPLLVSVYYRHGKHVYSTVFRSVQESVIRAGWAPEPGKKKQSKEEYRQVVWLWPYVLYRIRATKKYQINKEKQLVETIRRRKKV